MPQDGEVGLLNTRSVIRKYSPADWEAVFAICQGSPEAAQWTKDSYDQAISSGQVVLLAEVAERVRGFLVVRVASGEAEILNMAMDGSHRRQGIGSALLAAAVAEARLQHAECLYLEVRESNHGGIAFYHKHGFCNAGKRTGYYRDDLNGPNGPEDAVLMKKKLTG